MPGLEVEEGLPHCIPDQLIGSLVGMNPVAVPGIPKEIAANPFFEPNRVQLGLEVGPLGVVEAVANFADPAVQV